VLKLELTDIVRIAVGDPEIADIDVTSAEKGLLRVTGSKKGSTMLLVWKKDGSRKAYRLVIKG
jgi:Flp pilus assembly secretin CpaC